MFRDETPIGTIWYLGKGVFHPKGMGCPKWEGMRHRTKQAYQLHVPGSGIKVFSLKFSLLPPEHSWIQLDPVGHLVHLASAEVPTIKSVSWFLCCSAAQGWFPSWWLTSSGGTRPIACGIWMNLVVSAMQLGYGCPLCIFVCLPICQLSQSPTYDHAKQSEECSTF